MIVNSFVERLFARHPLFPALGYGAVVVALLMTTLFALAGIVQNHREVFASAELLSRLEHHNLAKSAEVKQSASAVEPQGSPFLEGPTLTVASAALLQRVSSAIVRSGGNLVSSEVAPYDVKSKDNSVRITAACEIEQKDVQQLLYDLEAGMPFLFIDQFTAEALQPVGEGGRMRVVLEVTGLWSGSETK